MKKSLQHGKFFLCLCLLLAMISAVGCSPTAERHEATRLDLFDTPTTVIAYTQTEDEFEGLSSLVFSELSRLDGLFDVYDGDSNGNGLAAVNAHAGQRAVKVDSDVMALLKWAKEAAEVTGGVIDASAGQVCYLWQQAREQASIDPEYAAIPSEDAIQEALQHRGMEQLVLDEAAGTAYLTDPEMRLDVGALAKGFAADLVIERLRQEGYSDVMLNLGGNVLTMGHRADGSPWRIGLRDPLKEGVLTDVPASDCSVVTSGGYERKMEFQGQEYHHIIDLSTGMPANRWAQVSVISKSSAEADLLTTALFILPEEEGRTLLAQFEDASVCYVALDGTMSTTEGWPE